MGCIRLFGRVLFSFFSLGFCVEAFERDCKWGWEAWWEDIEDGYFLRHRPRVKLCVRKRQKADERKRKRMRWRNICVLCFESHFECFLYVYLCCSFRRSGWCCLVRVTHFCHDKLLCVACCCLFFSCETPTQGGMSLATHLVFMYGNIYWS